MLIDIEGLTVTRSKPILKDVNWQVKHGEHWAILGMNGAGKTALLNVICGYQFPTKGSVRVLGEEFGQFPWQELRKKIGWVSFSFSEQMHDQQQNIGLEVVLSGTFGSIGLHEHPGAEDMARAKAIMNDLGVRYLERQPYVHMSQGEKQRMLIGRALMADPEILMLDEPCNGLDFFAKAQLLNKVEQLAERQKTTIIYVTHQVDEILPAFKQTLLLRDGEVFDAGRTKDMITSETLSTFCRASIQVQQKNGRYMLEVEEEQTSLS
ncbi:iron complex transport system ATP-binding protein [Geomicrobium halophilum]|uniref:Iron complex transport system ATP-binding protein n=1 Tax=Geomicrobium halophilum TaxID=549000 RepID=A0A841Q2E4_9BACL|nr:ATP-binding cassette domain-containing protein [Geomicrobium halophilum]MBB6450498.1 iron complex transport system ATP-binding protein [Geomicrobium halophilum]